MKKKQKLIFYIVLSIIIGYLLAGFLGKAFKHEAFKINENTLKTCTVSTEVCNSGIIPAYTLGSSGGTYGFPFKVDDYYCKNDDSCIVTRRGRLTSSITFSWVNVAIWSAISLILLYGGDKVLATKASKR